MATGTMRAPLVTIGLTTYNAADTVERALRSAVGQDWRPIEVVVVDDGSTDETVSILERWAARHPEIRIFRNPQNSGIAVSRNRILEEARGEFVAFFDDDDESMPDRVERQVARLESYEFDFADGAPVICHTARVVIYPDGTRRVEPTTGETEGRRAPAGVPVAHRVLLGTPLKDAYGACPTCSQMGRLSVYRNLGGFDPLLRRGEDTEFNIRLARAGGHFVGIGDPLVIQKMTKTSDKSLADEYKYLMYILEKHTDLLSELGQFEFCRKWFTAKQRFLENRPYAFIVDFISLGLRYPIPTVRRLCLALPNIGRNRRFRRFHQVSS